MPMYLIVFYASLVITATVYFVIVTLTYRSIRIDSKQKTDILQGIEERMQKRAKERANRMNQIYLKKLKNPRKLAIQATKDKRANLPS